jgi:hypothetical protein
MSPSASLLLSEDRNLAIFQGRAGTEARLRSSEQLPEDIVDYSAVVTLSHAVQTANTVKDTPLYQSITKIGV